MAKMPMWMRVESTEYQEDSRVVITFSVRRWHPAWWVFVFTTCVKGLWAGLSDHHEETAG